MPSVTCDCHQLKVEGKPVTLLCASLFYFRLPRECWEERMEQLRMCGYNCIDVYIPWNFHESRPGAWRFTGMYDVVAFLEMAHSHGLYVIARPGPYICSEWDGGALPAWLSTQQLDLRQKDGAYLAELDRWLGGSYAALDELRSVLRVGALPAMTDSGGPGDLLTTLLLLDLIAYEFLKNKLGRCHEAVFSVHEALGKLDAAIAAASWRASLPQWTEPELDFSGGSAYLEAKGMVHPLLVHAVPNDFTAGGPLLITGSNASGKSTYLKAVAWNAVLAQTLCTCMAEAYRGSAFRIYTSMALQDDLLSGESYYIVETRSLKRILDAAAEPGAVFCAVDEVLRGTNTVERIAAASAVLETLADRGVLCLAATHDGELTALLSGRYAQGHFTEQLEEDDIFFDYRLRSGPAVTRNAIELLRLMGVDGAVVDRARRRAAGYLDTGRWS